MQFFVFFTFCKYANYSVRQSECVKETKRNCVDYYTSPRTKVLNLFINFCYIFFFFGFVREKKMAKRRRKKIKNFSLLFTKHERSNKKKKKKKKNEKLKD